MAVRTARVRGAPIYLALSGHPLPLECSQRTEAGYGASTRTPLVGGRRTLSSTKPKPPNSTNKAGLLEIESACQKSLVDIGLSTATQQQYKSLIMGVPTAAARPASSPPSNTTPKHPPTNAPTTTAPPTPPSNPSTSSAGSSAS